jgi:hypothetical protein
VADSDYAYNTNRMWLTLQLAVSFEASSPGDVGTCRYSLMDSLMDKDPSTPDSATSAGGFIRASWLSCSHYAGGPSWSPLG